MYVLFFVYWQDKLLYLSCARWRGRNVWNSLVGSVESDCGPSLSIMTSNKRKKKLLSDLKRGQSEAEKPTYMSKNKYVPVCVCVCIRLMYLKKKKNNNQFPL